MGVKVTFDRLDGKNNHVERFYPDGVRFTQSTDQSWSIYDGAEEMIASVSQILIIEKMDESKESD